MDEGIQGRVYRLVPIFRTLDKDELAQIIDVSQLYRVKKGRVIIREGEPSDGMYIVVKGTAQVQMRLSQGDQARLAVLRPGDVFGELSLLDQGPRSATVIMREDGIVYRVDAEGFQRLRAAARPAAFKVIRELAPIIAARLREINNRVGRIFADPETSMYTFEQRYLESQAGTLGPSGVGDS